MTPLDQPIRLATAADARAISTLSRDLIEHNLPWRWTAGRVRAAIASKDTNCIVIASEQSLQAFAIVEFGLRQAHINLIAVLRELQGRGLGTRLLDWQTEVARVAGIQQLSLEVRRNNLPALRFYENLGFESVGIIERYYSGLEDGVRMERKLSVTT